MTTLGNITLCDTAVKFKNSNSHSWLTSIKSYTFTDDWILKVIFSPNITLSINYQYFPTFKEWIANMNILYPYNTDLILLKQIIYTYVPISKSYAYIICDSTNSLPKYAGCKHSLKDINVYFGSSKVYKPKPGDTKYIIYDSLTPYDAIQIENYLIYKLLDLKYPILNRTKGNPHIMLYKAKYFLDNLNYSNLNPNLFSYYVKR